MEQLSSKMVRGKLCLILSKYFQQWSTQRKLIIQALHQILLSAPVIWPNTLHLKSLVKSFMSDSPFFLSYIRTQWILNPQPHPHPPPRIYKGKRCQFKLEFIASGFHPVTSQRVLQLTCSPKNNQMRDNKNIHER